MKATTNREIILGLSIVVLALLALFIVIPAGVDPPSNMSLLALAPDFWPNVVMIFMALIGVIITLQGYVKQPRASSDESRSVLRAMVAIAMLFVYYGLLQQLGFVAASMLTMLAFALLVGEWRLYYVVPLALLLPILLYYFFTHVAIVSIPLGVFEDWP